MCCKATMFPNLCGGSPPTPERDPEAGELVIDPGPELSARMEELQELALRRQRDADYRTHAAAIQLLDNLSTGRTTVVSLCDCSGHHKTTWEPLATQAAAQALMVRPLPADPRDFAAQLAEAQALLGPRYAVHDATDGPVWVQWQEGTIPEAGVNGAQVEDVVGIAIERLRHLNEQYPCRENAIAMTNLEQAVMWLRERTADRERRGVEGKLEV